MRRALLITSVTVVLLLALAGAGGWWGYRQLTASLPVLDGQVRLQGLGGRVTVERDALGIPTIGRSREDVAAATGFLHAQDRFFQMDLARRRAAGELSALVGAAALPSIGSAAPPLPRRGPGRAVRCCRPADRALLDAYTGASTAACALAAPPFEYLVLRQTPRPGGPKTACSSCCRCSSRCRTRTATTSRRWPRCATCCRRRCSTSWPRGHGVGRTGRRLCRSRRRRFRDRTSTTCGGRGRASRRSTAARGRDVARLQV